MDLSGRSAAEIKRGNDEVAGLVFLLTDIWFISVRVW